MRRWLMLVPLLLILGGVVVSGCRGRPPLNVVLVSIDTLRADHLGCYGYRHIHTPHIDGFAERSVRFEHCFTAVPITLPSHTTMLTGMYPLRHSVRDNGTFSLPEDVPTLATILRGRGYSTMGVIGAFPLHSRFGLARGFDIYDEELESQRKHVMDMFFDERKADRVTTRALEVLDEHGDEPFFLFVHYFDPHHPWNPPPEYLRQHRKLPYDAEISYVDSWIGKLFGDLQTRGLLERTIVVLTADHGEGLDLDREFTHSFLVYNDTTRVPLLLYYPGVEPAVVDRHVSLADIAPTVLELLEIDVEHRIDGRSLLRPGPVDRFLYMETLAGRLERGWNGVRGCLSEGYKYIRGVEPELYRVDDDIDERNNLAAEQPERVASMDEALRRFIAAEQGVHTLSERYSEADAETVRKLRALGYLTGDGATGSLPELAPLEPDGDPRKYTRMVWIQSQARGLMSKGEFHQAVTLLEDARRVVPEDREFLRHLVMAYLFAEEWEKALAGSEEMLAAGVAENPEPLALAAAAHKGAGHFTEAITLYDQALAADRNPAFFLGKAACLLGIERTQAALECLDELLEEDGCNRDGLIRKASVLRDSGRRGAAERAYRRMVACDEGDPRPMYNLGNLYLESGDLDEARRWYVRARDTDPAYPAAHFGLALVSCEEGDVSGAIDELRCTLAGTSLTSDVGRNAARLLRELEEDHHHE